MPRVNVKDKRKQQLISATIDSIAKRGLTETTITHISKGAGMSRGIINFYFSSKEAMMRDVLGNLLDEYEMIWSTAAEKVTEPRAKLEALVNAHFDKKICAPKRLNVLSAFWGHAASHTAYREKIDASDIRLQQTIAALWKEIAPNGYLPEQFARQLHAMIRGLWLSYLMAPLTTKREALAAECLSYIEQHITPIKVVSKQAILSKPKPKPKAKAKMVASQQMDIEDLFASM